MGLEGGLAWLNRYSKKQCRSLLWKMRATVKKTDKNVSKNRYKFQYDPSSYALNFDDGCCDLRERAQAFQHTQTQGPYGSIKDPTWVFIIWVKPN